MQKIFFITAVLLAFSTFSNSQDVRSLKLSNAVIIDGNCDEWPQPFNFYNGETKLQYRIANDTSNIYICFKVTDQQAQMKMMRAGINVWIDPKGKKKESIGIRFPMKQDRSASESAMPPSEERAQIPGQALPKHDFRNFKLRAQAEQITMKLQGFAGVPDEIIGIKKSTGIQAAFNWDTLDILCIEYQIPIFMVLQRPFTAADTVKPLGLGFVVNALEATASWAGSDRQSNFGGNQNADQGADMNGGFNDRIGTMNRTPRAGEMSGNESYHVNSGYSELAQQRSVWSKLLLHF
jgi:hypothetical protein